MNKNKVFKISLLIILTLSICFIGFRYLIVPRRLTLKSAANLIIDYHKRYNAWLYKEMGVEEDVPILTELTTDEVWNKLNIQIFRATRNFFSGDYIIVNEKVYYLNKEVRFSYCHLFNFVSCDLNGDGKLELVMIYETGTVSRNQVGIFTSDNRFIESNFGYLGNLSIKKLDDRHVELWGSLKPRKVLENNLSDSKNKNEILFLGMVTFKESASSYKLDIEWVRNLPKDVSMLKLNYQ